MLSIIIPYKNDIAELPKVLEHLLSSNSINSDNTEIIIVNDGSVEGSGKFAPLEIDNPVVKVINNHRSFGVGASFDRGAEQAGGDVLVLACCDVFPHEGWYEKVQQAVAQSPNTLGCAVCVGDKPPYSKYYGADLLMTMGNDDLPPNSKLRERKGGYTNLFQGKWRKKQDDEPYELPCLMGSFYFTSKAYYNQIHGWDTEPGNKYCGHQCWGHLEPYISLKSWLHGGGCVLYPDIESTHLFNRIDRKHKGDRGARSAEWMFWNALFILETMIMSEFTRNRLYDFVKPELNFNVARHMIEQNYETIERIRERNRQEFKYDHKIFTEKFNYKFI